MLEKLRKFMNKSFGTRLLFFFVPYIVLLLISVTLLCFNDFFNTLKQEKENSTKTLVAQISDNFDYYFRDIKTTMAYMSVNNDIQTALTQYKSLSFSEQYFLNNRIVDATSSVNVFKPFITDILTIGKNGYQTNLSNASPLDPAYDLIHSTWLQNYHPSQNTNFDFTPPHKADYYSTTSPARLVVSAILPVIVQSQTLGYIQGDISYEVLRALLDTIYQQNDIQITMVTAQSIVVFDRDSSRVNTSLDQKIFAQLVNKEGSFTTSNTSNNDSSLVNYLKSDVTGWYLIASVPYSALLNPGYAVSTTILFIILPLSLVITLVTFFLLSKQFRKPWNRLVHRMETVNVANYQPVQIDYGVGEIAELGSKFESMLAQNNALIEQVYVAEIKKKTAELHTLREQITPHFIYNSLQVIKAEAIFAKNRQVSQLVTAFANLLRYSMDNHTTEVAVADEIAYIRNYLDIYKRRFGGKFDYRIVLPDDMLPLKMPKMVLQPLVENCIKHGFDQMKAGGQINIRGSVNKNECLFEIEDNGKGISQETLDKLWWELEQSDQSVVEGIGFYNVHQRIVRERGPSYGIIGIESNEGEYMKVVLKV
jgi:two-component system sensor histidine kinase YesM